MPTPPPRKPSNSGSNPQQGQRRPASTGNSSPARRAPQRSPQQPPAARTSPPAVSASTPPVKASEGAVSIKRQAAELAMKDKEIRILRAKVVKYEKIMTDIKNLAANISYTATKTNSVGPGVMSDWARKIFDIINGR